MLVYIPGKLASLAAILVRHRPVDIDEVLLISIYYHNTAALPLHEFYSPGGNRPKELAMPETSFTSVLRNKATEFPL